MLFSFILLVLAAIFYVVGGIAMKYSHGFQQLGPSLAVMFFFLMAAGIQTYGMKGVQLGGGYVFVLGLEAILAVLAGSYYFDESLTLQKILGMGFVVLGMILLKLK